MALMHLSNLKLTDPVRLFRDPIGFFRTTADELGPRASFQFGPQRFFLLNDPPLIKELLVTQGHHFEKFPRIDKTKGLFGDGLLTSEEPLHMRQRRLAQPAFHRDRLAAYASEFTAATQRRTSTWQDNLTLDLAHEMNHLALDIVSRTLFSSQTEAQAAMISQSLDTILKTLNHLVMPWGNLLLTLPTPIKQRYRRALAAVDEVVYNLIDARTAPNPNGDLLDMLLTARDADTNLPMPREQLRDEIMTIFVAGHDTTANALTWTLYLLSQHPDIQTQWHEEVDRVLQGRPACLEDAAHLALTTKIFEEALRLFPPVWILGRRALEETLLQDLVIPKNAIVLVSMAVLHRRPHLYEQPDAFLPHRAKPQDRYAYLPFGAGSRLCIGERFAWLEGILCLATIAQNWRIHIPKSQPVTPQPLLTLRPKEGLNATLEKRS
jgi:cytochrome P450